jgi:hypothetical protein
LLLSRKTPLLTTLKTPPLLLLLLLLLRHLQLMCWPIFM